ncbi:MAG TPA: M15 family metallopeptidase [Candidatus Binatia bacterium]|jgi:beta-N-acetylhexosaminidase/D-alanyl-D-alanine dipeptidase|nr:M15 family metallopeptidase [Candidatus Binatia bacterium]
MPLRHTRPLLRLLVLATLLVGCAHRDAFVDVRALDPTIRLDVRYATSANFTGTTVYPTARCLLRHDVAERLVRVQQRLRTDGLGLLVWDCYRPFSVQQRFWALVPDARYVAEPVVRDGRPVEGSKHNRGAAVDVTLVDGAGVPLVMPTDYDDFSARAHRDATDWSPVARHNADLLERAMVAEGFEPFPTEWWHFDGPGWQRYDLADVPLR